MIEHTVSFRLVHAPGSAQEGDFLHTARAALADVPGVQDFTVKRQVSAKSEHTFGFSMRFADQAAYDAYDSHPGTPRSSPNAGCRRWPRSRSWTSPGCEPSGPADPQVRGAFTARTGQSASSRIDCASLPNSSLPVGLRRRIPMTMAEAPSS